MTDSNKCCCLPSVSSIGEYWRRAVLALLWVAPLLFAPASGLCSSNNEPFGEEDARTIGLIADIAEEEILASVVVELQLLLPECGILSRTVLMSKKAPLKTDADASFALVVLKRIDISGSFEIQLYVPDPNRAEPIMKNREPAKGGAATLALVIHEMLVEERIVTPSEKWIQPEDAVRGERVPDQRVPDQTIPDQVVPPADPPKPLSQEEATKPISLSEQVEGKPSVRITQKRLRVMGRKPDIGLGVAGFIGRGLAGQSGSYLSAGGGFDFRIIFSSGFWPFLSLDLGAAPSSKTDIYRMQGIWLAPAIGLKYIRRVGRFFLGPDIALAFVYHRQNLDYNLHTMSFNHYNLKIRLGLNWGWMSFRRVALFLFGTLGVFAFQEVYQFTDEDRPVISSPYLDGQVGLRILIKKNDRDGKVFHSHAIEK